MDSHCNIPRDVRSIIYKYIWRDNYSRCIDEYKRIYVPHYKGTMFGYYCVKYITKSVVQ